MKTQHKYGFVIDVDRCTGCGSCMIACAVENNVPPAAPGANERTGITWLRVERAGNGKSAYIPILCQQCGEHTPCVSVCPQNAVEVDAKTGIVAQVPERCLGCRYCMAACPYHARAFNWHDPEYPGGLRKALNPDVAPRMRGVVEKCNFCHGRLHNAEAKAAAAGKKDIDPADYVPACVEACPARALNFGDLADPSSAVARKVKQPETFRMLESLGTEPKVYYRSSRAWVREMARPGKKEVTHA